MSGLENVVLCETEMSHVRGQEGELIIQGYQVGELAARFSLESLPRILWGQEVDLAEARMTAYERLWPHRELLVGVAPVDALSLGLSLLSGSEDAALLAASLPTVLNLRISEKAPDPALSMAEDFMRLQGLAAQPEALEVYWLTVCEHGMNASTFAGRVIASTGASLSDCLLGALSALKGPLHGGAPGPVLDLLEELQAADSPLEHLTGKVRRKERLMGFGHRVYKVGDPRAENLRKAASGLATERLEWAQKVEQWALEVLRREKPGRQLFTNVEFYTAILLDALGFQRELFTPLFACGRVFGWLGHIFEQRREGRLIRPRASYRPRDPVAS